MKVQESMPADTLPLDADSAPEHMPTRSRQRTLDSLRIYWAIDADGALMRAFFFTNISSADLHK